ncbi:MAG TPA: cell division protein ZapE [Beijerinckiaceae bacterium]|nr:cell division protein ZapE [Beijerinckiaceae bacterium]
MSGAVAERYRALVAEGRLEPDPAQQAAIERLDALAAQLEEGQLAAKGSALGWLFSSKTRRDPIPGLYLWGSVGRGKTMLMDLFFDELKVRHKRREHFHAFMSDVHERIYEWRRLAKAGRARGNDPVAPVARDLAREASVLCFDEFAVTDIADAMLLGRLFENLFAEGVTVVATSNREPDELYKDGLNRQLFVPFIRMIEQKMQVLRLDARTDYRMEKLAGAEVFLTPANAATAEQLETIFRNLTAGAPARPTHLHVKGRTLTLGKTAHHVALVSFEELCDRPLGAADYLAIAQAFRMVIIRDVPAMDQSQRNAAKRFINLIDVFYDYGVKTVISAAVPAQDLYHGTSGPEVFEFDRTVSRLIEMRSSDYLARPHGRQAPDPDKAISGIVET